MQKKLSIILIIGTLFTFLLAGTALAKTVFINSYTIFVKNDLVLAIPSSNPGQIANFNDLGNPSVRISIGHPKSVPAGNYTMQMMQNLANRNPTLEKAILKNIVSKDNNVRSVLDKVVTKEVDAGFIYRSDAFIASNKIKLVDIPINIQVSDVTYPIAVLKESANPQLAKQFIYYVNAKEGQKILADYGFKKASKKPLKYSKSAQKFNNKEITVYAAASLKNAFTKIGDNFEKLYGVQVHFQFDGSGSLASKIANGAPVDVFAAADLKSMKALMP